MDWRSVRFDWNRARAFLVTAEEGSLSAASKALGMTQPTLGRQVAALEDELGVALFERVGRGLTLTPNGIELVDHVRAMGEAASRISLTASGRAQNIEGTIRISASETYAAYLMPEIIARLRQAQPGIAVELVASNTYSDLKRREADIAIRMAEPKQADLIAKKIKDVPFCLYAASAYLDRIGRPQVIQDLKRAEFIGFSDSQGFIDGLKQYMGLDVAETQFSVFCEDHVVHWELVKHGLGIGVIAGSIGDKEPKVERAVPGMEPIMGPIWLVAHRELRTSRRVRFVFDFLAEELLRAT